MDEYVERERKNAKFTIDDMACFWLFEIQRTSSAGQNRNRSSYDFTLLAFLYRRWALHQESNFYFVVLRLKNACNTHKHTPNDVKEANDDAA